MSKNVKIKISINSETMVTFFKKDPGYGTFNKPYKADDFCEVISSGAVTTGIRNVFELEPDTEYDFFLSDTSTNPNFQIIYEKATYALSLIQESIASEADWAKVIDLDFKKPRLNINGSLIYTLINNQNGKHVFKIKTQTEDVFERNNNLFYDITFLVKVVEEGVEEIKIAQIDPLIGNTTIDPGQ